MDDLLQRAQGVLWRIFLMLAMFGSVGYIVWDAQVDTIPALLVPSAWFLYCCMLFFPTSRLALAVVYYFDAFGTGEIKAVILVLGALLLFHSLYQWSPVGILHIVVFGIMNRCFIIRGKQRELVEVAAAYLAAYQAATIAATRGLEDAPQPASPAAEPGQFDDSDGPHALVYFLDGPTVEEVVEPKPRARSSKNILWSILSVFLKLGVAVLVAHALIDGLLQNWAVNQAPVATPLFEAEVVVQANKTELPIRVPIAEFIPTSTFGSPCQAAPTPTPVAKSLVTVMSTPMPTPMPAPTPTAIPEPVPEPEPMPAHDEPLKLLHSLIDFDIPDPKPLLVWYFELPPASQYTVIVIALLVVWCLSKPLIALAVLLLSLASAYLTAAAVLPLLSIYGFTPKQSLLIVLPAALALIGGIFRAIFWLKNLASTSWKNTAELSDIKSDLEDLHLQSELGLADTRKSISAVFTILRGLLRCVARIKAMASEQGESIKKLNSLIKSLVMDKANKVDLDRIANTLKELSEKIGNFEDSKADASLLSEVQNDLGSLLSLIEDLQAEKADATDLKKFQQELQGLSDRFDSLQNTKANATEVSRIASQFKQLEASVNGMRSTQCQLTTDMNGAQKDINSLRGTSKQHGDSISRLDEELQASKNAIADVENKAEKDKKSSEEKISNLEKKNDELQKESSNVKQEISKVKRDFSNFQVDVKDMLDRIGALEDDHVKPADLQKLRGVVTSDTDQKVSQLRSETDSQHDQSMKAHRELETSVNTRFAGFDSDLETFKKEVEFDKTVTRKGTLETVGEGVNDALGKLEEYKEKVDKRFDEISKRIGDAEEGASHVLRRVEDVESQQRDSIALPEADDETRRVVHAYIEEFLVSNRFRAAVKDMQLILKKQLNEDRLRGEVHAAMEKLLATEDIQQNIYDNIKERQALNNLPGDPPGVISRGRVSPPSIAPPNPPAAPPNTDGNDDLPGDPAEVVTWGRATLPGGVSSDNTTTPTIPEDSTIPDDVDDHHGSHSVPLCEPPGVLPGRRARSLGGSTSDGPSGDDGTGPRPSGGDKDDMLQPKQLGDGDSFEHDDLTGEQPPGPANRDQPGGEQEKETDEEETDDDSDDDAHDDSDGDDSDDDNSPSPPPGSGGGSHGHNGAGGKDDDDQDRSNGGAPHPAPAPGTPLPAPGLANSRFAPDDFQSQPPAAGKAHHNNGTDSRQDGHQNGDSGGAPHPPPAPSTSRPAPSLAGSRFAPDDFQSRTPAAGRAHNSSGAGGKEDDHHDGDNGVAPNSTTPTSGVSHGRNSNQGGDGVARDDDNVAEPRSKKKNRNEKQQLRTKNYFQGRKH